MKGRDAVKCNLLKGLAVPILILYVSSVLILAVINRANFDEEYIAGESSNSSTPSAAASSSASKSYSQPSRSSSSRYSTSSSSRTSSGSWSSSSSNTRTTPYGQTYVIPKDYSVYYTPDKYEEGYDDVYRDGEPDWDRYERDDEYARGADDAMDDYEEYGEDW